MSFLLSSEELPEKRPLACLPRLDSHSPQETCRKITVQRPERKQVPNAGLVQKHPQTGNNQTKSLFLQNVNQHSNRNSHDLTSNRAAYIHMVCIACWEMVHKAVHSNQTSFFQSTDLLQPIATPKWVAHDFHTCCVSCSVLNRLVFFLLWSKG